MSTLFVFTSVSFATTPDIPATTTTVSCSDSAINTNNAPANLEINWEPNTINLHWYADENATTELTGSGIPTSCVYDGALTPPPVANIPQKTGYTFAGWKVRGLPDGYTKLQYVESTASGPYIDTGIVPTLNYSIEVKAVREQNRSLFGSGNVYNLTGSAKTYREYFYLGGIQIFFPKDAINHSLVHVWGYNAQQRQIYCDNIVVNATVGSTVPTENLWLFARSNKNATIDSGAHKIYYAKLWNETNQLVFNGIPARRNSDSVVGMWDTVTKTFFINAGSGAFTAGPVAQ